MFTFHDEKTKNRGSTATLSKISILVNSFAKQASKHKNYILQSLVLLFELFFYVLYPHSS